MVTTADGTGRLPLPRARGELTAALLPVLQAAPRDDELPGGRQLTRLTERAAAGLDLVHDDDVQLALFVLYELHYGGVAGVDEEWEWHPGLLALRGRLERSWEAALRDLVPADEPGADPEQVVDVLHELTVPSPRPGLASYLARRAGLEQYRELLVHRSVYHLKEADPHSFAIPRLHGEAKAALVEIQADEYGGGRPEWVHATLFAQTMTALGLDDAYGRYVDEVPAVSLAVVNAMSLFGLHRRLRGAVAGHLAAFEMTSTRPNRLYGQGLRRLEAPAEALVYFDEHVEADAVHEQIACRHLAAGLVRQDPALSADVLLGARVALALDDAATDHLLQAWEAGRTSLRTSTGSARPAPPTTARPASIRLPGPQPTGTHVPA